MSGSQRSRHTYGLLSNVSLAELESIRVCIKRGKITSNQPPGPMERSIDDPKALVPLVHCKKDHTQRFKSIFNREGIIVNKGERLDLIDAKMYDAPRSPPNTQYESKVCRNSSSRILGRKSRDRDCQESCRNRKVKDGSESRDRGQQSTDSSKIRDRSRRSRRSDQGQRSRSPQCSRSIDRHSSTWRKRSKDRSRERTIERWKSTDRKSSRRSRSLSRTIPSTSRKISYSPKRSSSRLPKRNKTKHYDYYERRSRSPQSSGSRDIYRYGRSHDYERDRRCKSERGRSQSPRHKETMVYRHPSLDFRHDQDMPDFWMNPMIRPPAYPMQQFYPHVFYPKIIPDGPDMYRPRYNMMPPRNPMM